MSGLIVNLVGRHVHRVQISAWFQTITLMAQNEFSSEHEGEWEYYAIANSAGT
jgi:hypothetical protein